jgi:hypothetical protein
MNSICLAYFGKLSLGMDNTSLRISRYERRGLFALLLFAVITFSGCFDKNCVDQVAVKVAIPTFLDEIDWQTNPRMVPARPFVHISRPKSVGKYLLFNELLEGIHIVDNTNPKDPRKVGFIEIPGNLDFDTDGQYLFADSYTDLLTFDVLNLLQPVFLRRTHNIFSNSVLDFKGRKIAYYHIKDSVVDFRCAGISRSYQDNDGSYIMELGFAKSFYFNQTGFRYTGEPVGSGGPRSRILLCDNSLFTCDNNTLIKERVLSGGGLGFGEIYPFEYRAEKLQKLGDYFGYTSFHGTSFAKLNGSSSLAFSDHFFKFKSPAAFEGAGDTLWYGHFTQPFANVFNTIEMYKMYGIQAPLRFSAFQTQKVSNIVKMDQYLIVCHGEEGFSIYDIHYPEGNRPRFVTLVSELSAEMASVVGINTFLILGSKGVYQYQIGQSEALSYLSHLPLQ